jgi:hypothetical protein
VPDNFKSRGSKAFFYEPDINPTYLDMADYYDTVVIPARVRKAKDKAKVEVTTVNSDYHIEVDSHYYNLPSGHLI